MKATLLAAALASVCAGSAYADNAAPYTLTANVGVVSNYVFRGISQSGGEPAIQGGVDFTHNSGVYLGTWLSSISWVNDTQGGHSPTEIDVYGGYRGTFATDYSYDVGLITYNYPGNGRGSVYVSPFTAEVYGQLGWKFLSIKYSHTVSENFVGWGVPDGTKSRNSHYLETNANYDLGGGWGLSAHVGHQWVMGYESGSPLGNASYTDWNVGATKDVGFGVLGLKWSQTNADGECASAQPYCWGAASGGSTYDAARPTVIVSFTKTF